MSAAVLTPTAQQQAILDAAATGDDVKILTSSPHSHTDGDSNSPKARLLGG